MADSSHEVGFHGGLDGHAWQVEAMFFVCWETVDLWNHSGLLRIKNLTAGSGDVIRNKMNKQDLTCRLVLLYSDAQSCLFWQYTLLGGAGGGGGGSKPVEAYNKSN